MSSHQLIIILFVGFFFVMGFLYLVIHVWEKYITQSYKRKEDQEKLRTLGEERMVYSSDYFNKLTKASATGQNLPTRPCDGCGAALNPEDKFCAVCGRDISEWMKSKKNKDPKYDRNTGIY